MNGWKVVLPGVVFVLGIVAGITSYAGVKDVLTPYETVNLSLLVCCTTIPTLTVVAMLLERILKIIYFTAMTLLLVATMVVEYHLDGLGKFDPVGILTVLLVGSVLATLMYLTLGYMKKG